MANTESQAQQIKDLLIEKIEAYDPTLNTAEGGSFYSQVVSPVFAALSVDPFDTDIEEFLLTRLRQEFPSMPAERGDAVVDLLIRPLQLLLESFKRELQIIRTGQSINNADQMRLEDAEDLAANFFVARKTGSRSSGVVRLYFRQPTFVSVLATTRFTSSTGLAFFPNVAQFYRPETVAVQRSGDYYYVDVAVVAESEGDEYNVAAGEITSVSGLASVFRVTNLFEFGGGAAEEDAEALLNRTRTALTERSLVTRRGIRARLFSEFPGIRNMEVVGYGDPEMQRDVMSGSGGMDNLCSGMCFLVGRYALLFSMFENRGPDEDHFIDEGGVLELNFWKFLYDVPREAAIQRFTVEQVIYNSVEDLENIPTVYIVKLDAAPDVDVPVASALPGVLPGVFFTAYKPAALTISSIPGGITHPDTADGNIVIESDSVHIGGHYDVYIRPSSSNTGTTGITVERSEVALVEGIDLVTSGEIPYSVLSLNGALKNKVHAKLRLYFTAVSGTLGEGEVIQKAPGFTLEEDTSAYVLDLNVTEGWCDLACLTSDTEWLEGEYFTGLTSGAWAQITSVEQTVWTDYGVEPGMSLNIVNGPDSGIYKILDVRGIELILDLEMTVLGAGYRFRVTDSTVIDAFEPKSQIYPFGESTANDLDTVIGTATVRVSSDLALFGVDSGDTLEILEGDNKGVYSITGFDDVLGTRAPILNRVMRSTDSNLEYVIYRPAAGLTLPLVRVQPEGMQTLDVSGQSTGFSIPPAEPVGAVAYQAFSGARASYLGMNGFVLPDPGTTWMPQSNTVIDLDQLDADGWLPDIEQYWGRPNDCYSSECKDYEDAFIAVISVTDMPDGSGGHDLRVFLDVDLPTEATDFLTTLRDWLVSVVSQFEMGDDFRAFIDQFAPFEIGAPSVDASTNVIAQYEVLIPKEIFDGCNNVFVAIPEYNWANEFNEDTTFTQAMEAFNNGELKGGIPALSKSASGGNLTILSGANAGSYVINKVYKYSLVNGGSINTAGTDGSAGADADDYIDKNKLFEICLVCIDDSFPVEPFKGMAEHFTTTYSGALNLPTPPSFNVESVVRTGADAGTVLGPWEVVQQSMTWLFQFLNSSGFTVPEELVLNPDSVLKSLTQSLFVDYVVGNTTSEQIIRMFFQEPTSVTAYGNRPCYNYSWHETETAPASITGEAITLPVPTCDGLPLTIVLTNVRDRETIEVDVTTEIAEETDPTNFVTLLQNLIDSDLKKVVVSAETTGEHTLALSFRTVSEGVDVSLRIEADDETQALRHLGFASSSPFYAQTIPIDPTTGSYSVRSTVKAADDVGITIGSQYQFLAFPDTLENVGSPAAGDQVNDATNPDKEGKVLAVLSSSVDSSTVVVIAIPGIPLPFSGDVYWRADNSTTYSPDTPVPYRSVSFRFGSSGYAGATNDSNGDPLTFSELDVPEVATAQEWEAGVASFNTNLQTLLPRLLIELFFTALDSGLSAVGSPNTASSYFPSYEFKNTETIDLDLVEDNFGLSVQAVSTDATHGGDGLGTEWTFKVGSGISSGDHNGAGSAFEWEDLVSSRMNVNFTSEDQIHDGVSWIKGDPVEGTSTSSPFYAFEDYSFTGQADSGTAATFGSAPTSAAEIDSFYDIFAVVAGYTMEDICEALNLTYKSQFATDTSGSQFVQFFVPVDFAGDGSISPKTDASVASYLAMRLLIPEYEETTPDSGGIFDLAVDADLKFEETTPLVTSSRAEGTSSKGEEHTEFVHPTAPTIFSGVAGSAELLYVATGTEEAFQVFPGETGAGRVLPKDLYRDLKLSSHFTDATTGEEAETFTAEFTEAAYASPLLAGVRRGPDVLKIYEQKVLLEVAGSGTEPLAEKEDRVVGVTTTYGSSEIQLLSMSTGAAKFSFLSSTSGLERDEIVEGDIIFIEEGDDSGGYLVVSVSETSITLDRALTSTSAQVYKSGNNGAIDGSDSFTDNESPFTEDDVGRYLTIYSSNYKNVDGSYQITEFVSTGEVVLSIPDGAFAVSETEVHWAVVKAPVDELEGSDIEGATELHGVVPIRVYNHIPTEWRIVDFRPTVDRADSNITCSYLQSVYRADNAHIRDLTFGPIRGHLQPYEIVREKVVHISSTTMKAQGRDSGLYYFDLRAKSLGGDSVFNIPKDTALTPVFGTFHSDGYRLEVEDPLFAFSMKEKNTKVVITPRFLPADLNDVEDNKVSTEGITLNIFHDYSALVANVQTLLLSPLNRVMCSDPLARHFLPSYVYFDVEASGGNVTMGSAIANYIDSLEPEEVLDISVFERFMHQYEVTSYKHPLTVQIITHDLDRRMVLTRSHDTIGSETDEADFNGSHRTTYYIPGDVTVASAEEDIPAGERIHIKRRG